MSTDRDTDPQDAVNFDSRVGRIFFADRWGLVLFLAAVCGLALFWRDGVFITDTYTVVRALDAVSSGTLQIDVVTGNHFAAPGAVISDGAVYGRNYGQVFLALPLLWGLEALTAVANLRVGLVALWHLGVLWLAAELCLVFEVRRAVRIGGSLLVLGSFLLNVAIATQFSSTSLVLLALQLLGLLAAGALAVLTYRLVKLHGEQRLAIMAGGASALVLPVGFWAQLPKRHVLVTAILLGMLYAFARSRSAYAYRDVIGLGPVPVHRAAAYGLVGLLAWIHAAEGLFVFLALVAVDVPTAPVERPPDTRRPGRRAAAFLRPPPGNKRIDRRRRAEAAADAHAGGRRQLDVGRFIPWLWRGRWNIGVSRGRSGPETRLGSDPRPLAGNG